MDNGACDWRTSQSAQSACRGSELYVIRTYDATRPDPVRFQLRRRVSLIDVDRGDNAKTLLTPFKAQRGSAPRATETTADHSPVCALTLWCLGNASESSNLPGRWESLSRAVGNDPEKSRGGAVLARDIFGLIWRVRPGLKTKLNTDLTKLAGQSLTDVELYILIPGGSPVENVMNMLEMRAMYARRKKEGVGSMMRRTNAQQRQEGVCTRDSRGAHAKVKSVPPPRDTNA
ncbi:hypothetical protein H4582DRAFT_2059706 [Lactarius indigo]|nr:hypothetical protein H4582DRAFT_2059706 [Lactarius indigo]